jgi:hypothetical protein
MVMARMPSGTMTVTTSGFGSVVVVVTTMGTVFIVGVLLGHRHLQLSSASVGTGAQVGVAM